MHDSNFQLKSSRNLPKHRSNTPALDCQNAWFVHSHWDCSCNTWNCHVTHRSPYIQVEHPSSDTWIRWRQMKLHRRILNLMLKSIQKHQSFNEGERMNAKSKDEQQWNRKAKKSEITEIETEPGFSAFAAQKDTISATNVLNSASVPSACDNRVWITTLPRNRHWFC